jgi:micrococcal nuclease
MTLYEYSAELERVVDGDTYDLTVDLGFNVYKEIRVRMLGIDTAETYGVEKESEEYQKGIEQKRFVEEWFSDSADIVVKTEKNDKGKYGRWLARVYNQDAVCLNDQLEQEFGVGR